MDGFVPQATYTLIGAPYDFQVVPGIEILLSRDDALQCIQAALETETDSEDDEEALLNEAYLEALSSYIST